MNIRVLEENEVERHSQRLERAFVNGSSLIFGKNKFAVEVWTFHAIPAKILVK